MPEPTRWVYIVERVLDDLRNGRMHVLSIHDIQWFEQLVLDGQWLLNRQQERPMTEKKKCDHRNYRVGPDRPYCWCVAAHDCNRDDQGGIVTRAQRVQEIYGRAAALLGWEVEDAETFSPRMLRKLLVRLADSGERTISSRARQLIQAIDWGLDPRNPHPLWCSEARWD